MASLKERLQQRQDLSVKDITLERAGGEVVTIRRLTVGERNKLVSRFKIGTSDPAAGRDEETGVTYGIAIVAASVIPPVTEDDVMGFPATIIDELAEKIMEFNGWTERSRKELADQFRAPAGAPV